MIFAGLWNQLLIAESYMARYCLFAVDKGRN